MDTGLHSGETFRTCSKCGKSGGAERFPAAIGFEGGRHAECKKCLIKRQIELGKAFQRGEPPQSERERSREQKRIVEDAKRQPCSKCGDTFSEKAMRFVYVRGKRAFRLYRLPRELHTETLHNELAKCEVMCANCMAEHKGDGQVVVAESAETVKLPAAAPGDYDILSTELLLGKEYDHDQS